MTWSILPKVAAVAESVASIIAIAFETYQRAQERKAERERKAKAERSEDHGQG